jgi:hypothetical protein
MLAPVAQIVELPAGLAEEAMEGEECLKSVR